MANNNNEDYYILKIYFDRTVIGGTGVISEYKKKIKEIQDKFEVSRDIESGETIELDAGFDLFVPNMYYINPKSFSTKINYGINCSMSFNGKPTAYYLYPRSSMGSKTPLRLSNSIGLVDRGYTGELMIIVDNIDDKDYIIEEGSRLVQLVGPNHEINSVNIVDKIVETSRSDNGFGSTGN